MKKICTKCKQYKEKSDFRYKKDKNGKYYISSYCKECETKIKKEHYYKNIEKYKLKNKKYRENNKEKLQEIYVKYKETGRYKKYREQNPDKFKQYAFNYKQIILNDPIKKFKRQTRDIIRNAFRRKGYLKETKSEQILGCEYNVFIEHLLKTFETNYGYKYDYKEKVHIDHIIPLSTAKTEKDVIALCHYLNLQLLKAEDNLRKGKKTNYRL